MLRDLVDCARKFRRSEGFKYSMGTASRLVLHGTQRLNKRVFSIDIHENSGLFSVLQMVLFILTYCEDKGLEPRIAAHGRIYGDPEGKIDWFAALFEPVQNSGAVPSTYKIRTSKVRDLVQLGLRPRYEHRLRLDSASRLFLAHYRPAADIVAEVDSACQSLDVGAHTLGVHFRGTDKRGEAEAITWEAFCRRVDETLAHNPDLTTILVSSDEQPFIEFFRAWPFSRPVNVAPAKFLSNGSLPIHFAGYPGLQIGREALICCLLLARCGFLLKTPSYLSAWSKIFNPSLPVTLVCPPRPEAFWFPDSRLWLERDHAGHIAQAADSTSESPMAGVQPSSTAFAP